MAKTTERKWILSAELRDKVSSIAEKLGKTLRGTAKDQDALVKSASKVDGGVEKMSRGLRTADKAATGLTRASLATARAVKIVSTQAGKAGQRIGTFARGLKSVAVTAGAITLALGPLAAILATVAAGKLFGDSVEELRRVSLVADRIGTTTEKLSGLRFAAESTGADVDKLDAALQEMTLRLGEAASGSGAAFDGLQAIGLSVKDLKDLDPADAFIKIADALNKLDDRSLEIFNADELFGGDSEELLTLIQRGGDGIRELVAEADRLGVIVTKEQAESAERVSQSLTRVTASFRGLRNLAVERLGGPVSAALDAAADFIAQLDERVAAFRNLISSAAGGDNDSRRQVAEIQTALSTAIQKAVSTSLRLVVDVLVEAGRLAAIAFGGAVQPILQDVIADYVPGIAKSAATQLREFDDGPEGQKLKAYERQLEQARGRLQRASKELSLLDGEVGARVEQAKAELQVAISNFQQLGDKASELQAKQTSLAAEVFSQGKASAEAAEASLNRINPLIEEAGKSFGEIGGILQTRIIEGLDRIAAETKESLPAAAEVAGEEAGENLQNRISRKLNDLVEVGRTAFVKIGNFGTRAAIAIGAEFEKAKGIIAGLDVRRLQAFGRNDEADDLQRKIRQEKELAEATVLTRDAVLETQAAENRRIDLDRQRAASADALTQSFNALVTAEARRNREVEQGQLSLAQANELNRQQRDSLVAQSDAAEQVWLDLRAREPEFAAYIDEVIAQIRRIREEANAVAQDASLGISDGLRAAFNDLEEQAQDSFSVGKELGESAAGALGNISDAAVDAAVGLGNFGQAARKILSEMALNAAKALAQFVLIRAITGGFGGFFSGGGAVGGAIPARAGGGPSNRSGPMVNLAAFLQSAQGFVVPGRRTSGDSMLAALQPGEYVLSLAMIRRLGGLQRLLALLQSLSNGANIPRFAAGGLVAGANAAARSGLSGIAGASNTTGLSSGGFQPAGVVPTARLLRELIDGHPDALRGWLDENGYRKG